MPDLCRRPLLRPGVLVTRRDDQHLQIGLDPGLVLPATEANRRVVADLVAGRRPTDEARAGPVWRLLVERDLLVDGDDLSRRLPPHEESARAVAAVYAVAGDRGGDRLHRRAGRLVDVDAPDPWGALAVDLLGRSGVPTTDAPAGAADRRDPDVRLVVSLGPLERARLDASLRDDVAHVVVAGSEHGVEVGPFVLPGLSACLRCADAARAELDPQRGLVVDQQARQGTWRPDGVPLPWDPVVATAAVAWAVRDIVTFLDDDTPTTWSATLALGPGMEQQWRRWRRHPRCGCAWLALEQPG